MPCHSVCSCCIPAIMSPPPWRIWTPASRSPPTAESGTVTVHAQEPITFGHKLALVPLAAGAPVYKYGEVIGVASADILAGAHVHVHNVESQPAAATSPPPPSTEFPVPPPRGEP